MKVKSKEKLKSKGDLFATLDQLDAEASGCHVVGLMLGVILVGIVTLSMFIAH